MPKKRKVTLVMDEGLFYDVQQAVQSGLARSQSGLVSQALTEYLAAAHSAAIARSYEDASRDPAFLADLDQVQSDFHAADAESDRT